MSCSSRSTRDKARARTLPVHTYRCSLMRHVLRIAALTACRTPVSVAVGVSLLTTAPAAAQVRAAGNAGSAAASGQDAPREFRIDAGHSAVEFSIGFLFSRVKGRFDSIRGTILYGERDPSSSSVTVVIDAKSISTGSKHRRSTRHLLASRARA